MGIFRRANEVKVPFLGAPLHKTIVPDKDIHYFGISHPKHVDLTASPLVTAQDPGEGHGSQATASHGAPESHHFFSHSQDKADKPADGEPVLRRPHEAPTIQLFFDLYFVANLTTFSGQHDIHDWDGEYRQLHVSKQD